MTEQMRRGPHVASACSPHSLVSPKQRLDSENTTLPYLEVQRLVRARRERLLALIGASRSQFQREILSRRRLLSALEPPPVADALIAAIEKQWARLYDDYRRYRKAVPYPGERRGWR